MSPTQIGGFMYFDDLTKLDITKRFADRLAQLRIISGKSARDMSLTIGRNPGYINNIEKGNTLPSMLEFVCICDYLGVTPAYFFEGFEIEPEGNDSSNTKEGASSADMTYRIEQLTASQKNVLNLLISEFSENIHN